MFLTGHFDVVDVLMLVANVAPVALYFLVLGLVNSHARPYLITSRSDFIILTSVLIPVLMWPVPSLAGYGTWWPLIVGACLALAVFLWMLPSAAAGFVIYNVSESRCIRFVSDTLRTLGLRGRWEGNTWLCDSGTVTIHVSHFELLRNVTLHLTIRDPDRQALTDAIAREMTNRLATVSQLPSTMGVCLVIIGVSMMIVPMWMVGHHIHDLVDAMSHIFG